MARAWGCHAYEKTELYVLLLEELFLSSMFQLECSFYS